MLSALLCECPAHPRPRRQACEPVLWRFARTGAALRTEQRNAGSDAEESAGVRLLAGAVILSMAGLLAGAIAATSSAARTTKSATVTCGVCIVVALVLFLLVMLGGTLNA